MSQQDDNSIADMIHLMQVVVVDKYITAACTALSLYDYLLTAADEVRVIRSKRLNGVTIVLLLARYINLVYWLLGWVPVYTQIMSQTALYLLSALRIIESIPLAVFSALRVFVLSEKSTKMFLVVLTLALAPFAGNTYITSQTYCTFTDLGDVCVSLVKDDVTFQVNLACEICATTSEIIALIVTWKHTSTRAREGTLALPQGLPIHQVLLRDGRAFFMLLVVSRAQSAIIQNVPTLRDWVGVSAVMQVTVPILMYRFIFNLRESAEPRFVGDSEGNLSRLNVSAMLAAHMQSIVGNAGEMLRDDAPDAVDEDEHGIRVGNRSTSSHVAVSIPRNGGFEA